MVCMNKLVHLTRDRQTLLAPITVYNHNVTTAHREGGLLIEAESAHSTQCIEKKAPVLKSIASFSL